MAKTVRSKTGWPGKKRTYHCGRKRCRYLKDMREERRLEHEEKARADVERSPRLVGRRRNIEVSNSKKDRSYVRDYRGRRIRISA